jgi:gliding motility-associated transport system permease protein
VSRALAICRRELETMFGGPLAWVLAAVFVGMSGYFLYTEVQFFTLQGGANLATGLWPYVFLDVRLVTFVVVPLITMRLVAEERKLGTFELLCSLPVRDAEIVAGKYLAVVAAYLAMLAGTTVGPLVLWLLHPFAVGPLVAGYLGLLLLGLAFLACGLAISATTENQVVAAMVTYGLLLFLWFVSWNEAALSIHLLTPLRGLSLFEHFHSFARGVIDSRGVVYFLGFTAFFLFLAVRVLGARAWRGLS